jgi:4,5-DOPA dioxygenase extradiol
MDKPIAPTVFVSHGTPMLAWADDAYVDALRLTVQRLPAPTAVVVLSANGFVAGQNITVDAAGQHRARHDHAGFPAELAQEDYRAPGDPELATQVVAALAPAFNQHEPYLQAHGMLDHAAWMPLRVMFPLGNIPVVPVHAPADASPKDLLRMGKCLAPLRRQGVWVVGTGGVVHNLEELVWHGKNAEPHPFAAGFQAWFSGALRAGNVEALARYAEEAPHVELAHPTAEHILPSLFALGAALPEDRLDVFFEGIQYRSVSMLSFALAPPQPSAGPLTVHG